LRLLIYHHRLICANLLCFDLVINNDVAGHTATFGTPVTWNNITRNITINPGTTLNFGNNVFLMNGNTLTNNGTLTHNGASSRFVWFLVNTPQAYTGNGMVTAPMTSFETQNGNVTLDPASPNIVVRRIILFVGGIVNANKLTFGNGDAIVNVIQLGNTTTPTDAGVFDVAPTFNLGTGGQNISYLRTVNARTTGPEVNPARTLVNLTYDDNDPMHSLTIAGGDLTATGTMTLTNGIINTGSNVLTHNGTVTRTNGFVNGNLNRSYTATGSYTYHVGQNGYSPIAATISALGTNPSSLRVSPTDAFLLGLVQGTAVSRFWSLTETGDLTANLTFTYLDADVNGNEANYKVFRRTGIVTSEVAPSAINPATNMASVNGITDFSDWGIGETLGPLMATIDGRVVDTAGQGIPKTMVALSNAQGIVQTTLTSPFGYYQFSDVPTTVTYTISVSRKRYQFTPPSQTFLVVQNISDVNFTGTPQDSLTNPNATYFVNAPFDFDGDGRTDISIWRESESSWFILRSSDNAWTKQEFGLPTDTLAPGDYDGDGTWDMAVFRRSEATWYIWLSASNTVRVETFGSGTDSPIPSDYDGDGMADLAVWSEGKNVWTIKQSSDGVIRQEQFENLVGKNIRLASDYDSDGKADLAIVNKDNGNWQIRFSKTGNTLEEQFGTSGDTPIAGDFDGDAITDLAVFRANEGSWLIKLNGNGGTTVIKFGIDTDNLVGGDYDGDGKFDVAVYRNGTWFIRQSSNKLVRIQEFGLPNDIGIPSTFNK
jgi:hypothetical protein